MEKLISKINWRRMALAYVSAFIAWQVFHIDLPPNGIHKWREYDTASVAENFYRESADIFSPRVNVRGQGSGVVGMEFPIYNFASGLGYRVFGFTHAVPRIISVSCALIYLLFLFRLGVLLYPQTPKAPYLAVILGTVSPLLLFYGGKIQPDTLGLAASTGGVYFFIQFLRERRSYQAAICIVALAMAGAVKPQFLLVGLPLLSLVSQCGGKGAFRAPRHWIIAILTLLPILTWFAYAKHLNRLARSKYFYLGGNWQQEFGGVLKAKFYQNLFLTWPFEIAVPILIAPLLLWAIFKLPLNRHAQMIKFWFAGVLIVSMLSSDHVAVPHEYYFLPALTPILLTLSHFLAVKFDQWTTRGKLALLTVILIAPIFSMFRIDQRYDRSVDFFVLRAQAEAVIPAGDLVVSVDTMPGKNLYLTGRKGYMLWTKGPDQMVETVFAGAKWLVLADGLSIPQFIQPRVETQVLSTPQFQVFRLKEN